MRRIAGLVAVLTTMALVGAACSDDNNKSSAGSSATTVSIACAQGTVAGAGSTFVQNIAQQWIKDFQAACPGATINYQGVGSGAGITQLTNRTVDFGASDVPMTPQEEQAAVAKGGLVQHIPWTGGGIAIEYNLSGVTDLKLSANTLAGIFAGKIKTWSDPAVKGDNPSANLPNTGIQVIHRSDGSGTTAAFTGYLKAVVPSVWTAGSGKDVPWPTGQGAKGSDGVTAAVKQTQGAIGYAEVSYAKGAQLSIASIKNQSGSFVQPDAKNVSAALGEAEVPADLKIQPNYKATSPDAYPISTPSFAIVYAIQTDAAKAQLLKAFLSYAVGSGQSSAGGLFYAPLPSELASKAKAAVDAIKAS